MERQGEKSEVEEARWRFQSSRDGLLMMKEQARGERAGLPTYLPCVMPIVSTTCYLPTYPALNRQVRNQGLDRPAT